MNALYTIGHSNHTIEKLIELLQLHRINAVGDVRSHPYSPYNPQFNRGTLKAALATQHTAYVFLGEELGARSNNPACYIEGKVNYRRLAEQPLFAQGIERLKKGMQTYRIALLCAEQEPLVCHRTILICRSLRPLHIAINHILHNGELECHEVTEKRLMQSLGIYPDMFKSESQCIEEAYDKQAERIAYVKPVLSTHEPLIR